MHICLSTWSCLADKKTLLTVLPPHYYYYCLQFQNVRGVTSHFATQSFTLLLVNLGSFETDMYGREQRNGEKTLHSLCVTSVLVVLCFLLPKRNGWRDYACLGRVGSSTNQTIACHYCCLFFCNIHPHHSVLGVEGIFHSTNRRVLRMLLHLATSHN